MAMMNNAKAAKARARMAKRGKRARFMKENKKRLMIAFLGVVILAFLAFFTPWGPDYYRARIEERKMETARNIAPGAIHDLYKLGVFYGYTMRSNDALNCYDEIGRLFFGFKLMDYSLNPQKAYDARVEAETKINRGLIQGPPFVVADSDIPYVALAIWRMGEIIQHNRSKQFTYNIYKDLYLDELAVKYPDHMDPGVTEVVQAFCDRFRGGR